MPSNRKITPDQAAAVVVILTEECGWRPDADADDFIRYVCEDHPNAEWRFMGSLGYGGKFRNNGNCNDTPHVDYYGEDETPARRDMAEKANRKLASLFGPAEYPGMSPVR